MEAEKFTLFAQESVSLTDASSVISGSSRSRCLLRTGRLV